MEDAEKQQIATDTCNYVAADTGVNAGDLACAVHESAAKRETYNYYVDVSFKTGTAAQAALASYSQNEEALNELAAAAVQSISSTKLQEPPKATIDVSQAPSGTASFHSNYVLIFGVLVVLLLLI